MITVVESANQEISRFLLPYMPKVEKAETIIYWTISSVKVDEELLTDCWFKEGTKEAAVKLDWKTL